MSHPKVHAIATISLAMATVPNRLQLILMLIFGVGVDCDHIIFQWERFFYALKHRKEGGFFEAWNKAHQFPQRRTNWLHSWPFWLLLGVATVAFQFSPLPLIAFSVHMVVDGFNYFSSLEFRRRSWLEAPVLIRRIVYKIYTLLYTNKGAH